MRFASLSLERYGRFEDCTLDFRSGTPDLHVVYGANEAGKTTSLAAVSDLLFGFSTRSPYNFLFDYSLLRVGATLEEAGQTFACRRKKGTSGTLLDAHDAALDEGVLLSMLRGQTRDTFALSFSLNQDGLRAGGRAMVDARDDASRALFAAGSGLTSVSNELARLEAESEAIWGPRKAQRRSFTQLQTAYSDHSRAARDQALRPKSWLDAKAAVESAEDVLADAQQRRDNLLAEVKRAERIRRIAPFVRLRSEHIAALAEYANTTDISPQREEVAETAMGEVASAVRAKSAAEQLAAELIDRAASLTVDSTVLDQADRIDELVLAAGVVRKARAELGRLEAERDAASSVIEKLRAEAGTLAAHPPTRIVSSQMRDLALAHAEDTAALRQIGESEADLAQRTEALAGRVQGADEGEALAAITLAVDAARALGADADERCSSSKAKAMLADQALGQAMARLAPWTGNVDDLLRLPRINQVEIDAARNALSELNAEAAREIQSAARSRDEAAALLLQMHQLTSGAAISADEIAGLRSDRLERWQPLRENVLSQVPLPSPEGAVAAFETAIAKADERSDLRFAAADESSRLAVMEQRRATLLLEADQADARAKLVNERAREASTAWNERLTLAGYSEMGPGPLQSWMADRDAAEAAHHMAVQAWGEAQGFAQRRNKAREDLTAVLTSEGGIPEGLELLPVLAVAERVRRAGEEDKQQSKLNQAALEQLEQDAAALNRRRKRIEAQLAERQKEWRELAGDSGIELAIAGATATLDMLDELRSGLAAHNDLQGRIERTAKEAKDFVERVEQVSETTGTETGGDCDAALEQLRSRLTAARSAAQALKTLQEDISRRTNEIASAEALRRAAHESLADLMDETASVDIVDLTAAIERSRAARAVRRSITAAEAEILSHGDGYGLDELIASTEGIDIDSLAARARTLDGELATLNTEVEAAAGSLGEAKRTFAGLEANIAPAVDAASSAELARAELAALAEDYILKRTQAVTLRWTIEQYRERHQDPMLLRASTLFSTLTLGRYVALKVDSDGPTPRLLALRDDGRSVVEVGAMSEGTADQLFLALRLAAVEQSIAAGVVLPFLADDLFVNFDDERSEAGFRVLAELGKSTQVLFFTHHPHLASIARSVVGADAHSECMLA